MLLPVLLTLSPALLGGIPLYEYTTIYTLHSPVDGNLDCFHFLALMKRVAIIVHICDFGYVDSFVLGNPRSKIPGSEYLCAFLFSSS